MSSSDSEDENLARAREAVVDFTTFTTKAKKTNGAPVAPTTTPEAPKSEVTSDLKSLRRSKTDELEDQFRSNGNSVIGIRVTPEFQAHVAKRLSKFLDEELERTIDSKVRKNRKSRRPDGRGEGGVKLFSTSSDFVDLTADSIGEVPQKRPRPCSKTSDSDKEQLAVCAVDPSDVLSKKDTWHWSTRSKAPVYRYKSENGDLGGEKAVRLVAID